MNDSTASGKIPAEASTRRADSVHNILEHLLEGFQVIGRDFTYLYVNDAVAKHGRTTKDALLGRTMTAAYPGIENTKMFAVLRECMERRAPRQMENEFIFPDGKKGWFELRFEPVPQGVAVLSVDITGRKEAEDRRLHLNKVLRGIRSVSQLICRERDRDALIRRTCELLCVSRGYHTVCIVLTIEGRIITSADAGDQTKLRVLREMLAVGTLPSCMKSALSEVGVCVPHHSAEICDSCPVRIDNVGMREAAAVRIDSEDEIFGVLQVSLTREMAQDPEEIGFLKDMANEIAFALRSIALEQTLDADTERFRAAGEQLSAIVHAAPAAIFSLDAEGRVTTWNSGAERLFGWSAAETLGKALPFIPDDKQTEHDRIKNEVLRGESFSGLELERRCKDGKTAWIAVSTAPLRNKEGRVDGIMEVAVDISQRKRAEENLVYFSSRLERLTTVVQDLSQARSVEAVVEIVRHAARSLADADGATFVLRDGDQCHYVEEDAVAPLWKGKKFPMSTCISGWAMLNKQPAVIEDIYADARIPHDAYRPTFVKSLVMVPIRRQSPIGAIGTYWATQHLSTPEEVRILQALADSTSVALENVRFMHELEEEKARTRAVYDHLPTAAFVWENRPSGFYLADFNEAAKALSGGEVVHIIGKSARELPVVVPFLEEDLARCYEERVTIRREVEIDTAGHDGRRTLDLTYGFVPADKVIVHAEDVTEQRRTEEQLKLSQRLEAVGRLAGGVAHDFNNMLSVIINYADFAADELDEGDPVRAKIEEIQRAGERAATLTRRLLAFSRKQVLEPKIVNLNDIVRGIETMTRRLLGEDIEIEVHLSDDLENTSADPGQIEQVVMNLAVNARDAMPEGGKLTIGTRNVVIDEDYEAQHVSAPAGNFVMLSVTDTGTGMDAETRAHIFDPFFTTKEKDKGTGLGLATVYGTVKQSGGNIWVYSEPGQGTTFKIYLPAVNDSDTTAERSASPAAVSGTGSVLLVEDEVSVCQLTERMLTKAGYRVLSATSVQDALILFEKHKEAIDLLLTDVVMPRMSGRELAESLVRQSPGLRVLYMSGYTDDAIVRHGVLEQEVHFISKPFTSAELTRKVRDVLADGRPLKN